jgi:glutaredoxin 3
MRVVVYSTTYCGFCRRAEDLLERKGIRHQRIDVTGDDEARAELIERTGGRRTVPVIFIDGTPIGGYRELVALANSGALDLLVTKSEARP